MSTSASNTTTNFENMSSPSPHTALITFRACPGYRLSMENRAKLWKIPSAGRFMSTTSGTIFRSIGRKIRSVAFPMKTSSIGGLPTMVAG